MNTSIIMTAAHAATRATVRAYPKADYRATLAAALRECYAAARRGLTDAAAIAAAAVENDPRAEWYAMSGEEQYNGLRATVYHCRERDAAETDRMGNPRPNYFAWIRDEDDIAAVVAEAWLEMETALSRAERAVSDGKRDSMPSLRAVGANAARAAARRVGRAEVKHANAIRYNDPTGEDGSGDMLTVIDTEAGATAERIAPDPYAAAALAETLAEACHDERDRDIVALTGAGFNQREIADRIGISQQKVSRRLSRIRARYEDARSIPAAAAVLDAAASRHNRKTLK